MKKYIALSVTINIFLALIIADKTNFYSPIEKIIGSVFWGFLFYLSIK